MSVSVQGYCPMGCGETLFLGEGGFVTCAWIDCPKPDAVSTILSDHEINHIVELKEETFTVRHPLRERLGDALMECDLDSWLVSLDGPPAELGKHRAARMSGGTLGSAGAG